MVPPFSTSGGNTMLTRLPSASRASTIGLASSIRRPIRARDALRDVDEMLGITKPCGGLFELAAPFDIDVEWPVCQDVGDFVVIEERFERPKPDHIVTEIGGERHLLDLVELNPFFGRDLAYQLGDLDPQCRARKEPATVGSILVIRTVRILSFSSLSEPKSPMGTGFSAEVSPTRTKPGRKDLVKRRPNPVVVILRTSTMVFLLAVALRSQPRAWQPPR